MMDDDFDLHETKRRIERLKRSHEDKVKQAAEDQQETHSQRRESQQNRKRAAKQTIQHLKQLVRVLALEQLLTDCTQDCRLEGIVPEIVSDRDRLIVAAVVMCQSRHQQAFLIGLWLEQRSSDVRLTLGAKADDEEIQLSWAIPPGKNNIYQTWHLRGTENNALTREISQAACQLVTIHLNNDD